ncbi:hypothetical protein BGZ97_007356 [Linnemannia gamsii]|uniref:Uncharacterized protein n=1 Tax=Linnemannia gamsii TaxID=64522 RepID=A0A9P6RFB5_9FUNG|nr:hypothetical protein BGZ97_007356 [Linnemannia gamsii]
MPHFNKEQCLDYKDAFVALSGIWNTLSVAANQAFTPLQLQEVRALCKVQEMDRKEPEIDDLVKVLAEILETGTLEEVMEKTYDLQVQSPSLRCVLHVLQLEAVFSTGSSPRNCDCLLTAGGIEVGNFECKKAGSAKVEVSSQQRKNLKINKSILLELENYELESPLLLSIHGLSATIFKIVKYEDIWVGAKACDPVLLPEQPEEFEHFLSEHLQRLMNLLHQYDVYGRNVVRQVTRAKFRKKAVEDDEEDQGSQSVMESLEWENVVLRTPTKPAKSTLGIVKRIRDEADAQ